MITNAMSVAGIKSKNSITQLDDGLLEYVFIKMPQNVLELQNIIMSLLNSKIDERYMYYGQAKVLKIQSEEMAWTLDGESGGTTDFAEIRTYRRALNIVVGSDYIN